MTKQERIEGLERMTERLEAYARDRDEEVEALKDELLNAYRLLLGLLPGSGPDRGRRED